MKFKKIFILALFPFLLTGCNISLYTPNNENQLEFQTPNTNLEDKNINVINESNYNGSITYADNNQTLLTSQEVYNKGVTSTVYIIASTNENYKYLGSGVFFSEDANEDGYAYLFTNAHVVAETTNIEIIYSNYKRDKATLVGYHLLEDVAVLKVRKNDNYTIATLKTSDKLETASEILTIGAPISVEYSFTSTKGIISKINSPISSTYDESYYLLLLQIDAALNQGNSGGPLFDMYGNLIGINTMKVMYDQNLTTVDDINFSIPIERAVFIANTIFENKPYTRGLIGVTITDIIDLSIGERSMYDIDLDYGLYVLEVSNDGASKGVIQSGDVITKINEVEFITKYQFQKELFNHGKGDSITLQVYRNNQYHTVNITLK